MDAPGRPGGQGGNGAASAPRRKGPGQRLPAELEKCATFHADEDSFLGAIDVISMHVPGGDATRKWLNAARLAKMKKGAIVINTGRGPSVDDEALIAALKSGHIRAAGLDVYTA